MIFCLYKVDFLLHNAFNYLVFHVNVLQNCMNSQWIITILQTDVEGLKKTYYIFYFMLSMGFAIYIFE